MSEMTHSRPPLTRLNYSGIAWYCPRVVAILKAPGGSSLLCEFLKVTAVFIPPLSPQRKELELMAYWEYCFPISGLLWRIFSAALGNALKGRPHSMAKHTARSCWCPWCLSICRREIMAFTAQSVPTPSPVFGTRALPPTVLCVNGFLVNNESRRDGKGNMDNISTLAAPQRTSLHVS